MECSNENTQKICDVLTEYGAVFQVIGRVTDDAKVFVKHCENIKIDMDVKVLLYKWFHGLEDASI